MPQFPLRGTIDLPESYLLVLPSYKTNVRNLLCTSQKRCYTKVEILFTIRLPSTDINRIKTMNWWNEKMKRAYRELAKCNTIHDEWKADRNEFLQLLFEFEKRSYGHLRPIKRPKYRTERASNSTRPNQSTQHSAEQGAKIVAVKQQQKMCSREVRKTVNKERASLIVLPFIRGGSLASFVDCYLPNTVKVRDSYTVLRVEECIDTKWEPYVFSTPDTNLGYWHIELYERDRSKKVVTFH